MDISKRGKVLKSAYESPTFDIDLSIHVDRSVGSASISPSNRDVVLASTDGLDIIDLDSPLSPPRHLRNGSRWLVSDVQWSPFAARDYWVVSTANQNVLVWNLNKQEDTNGCIEHTLAAHQRAITDINFSAHHPDILATCAVDGYVHIWDLRRPKKPVNTFTDWFGGATQVKCNRQNPHIFASSHDRWLRIWDDRNSAVPLRSINAHASKIYGVDWNRTRETAIVTCSLDKTIKFWDYSKEVDEERTIQTGFPVWRARHTPFGFGLLAMSQDVPGDLYLYERRIIDGASKDSVNQAVKIFPSCSNVKIKEFLWRSRGEVTEGGVDNRDFQLISWGDDNNLRLHTVETNVLEKVGYIKGTQKHSGLNITRNGAVYKTFRVVENTVITRKAPTISKTPKLMNCGFKMNTLTVGISKKYTSRIPKFDIKNTISPGLVLKVRHADAGEQKKPNKIDWMSGIKIRKPIYFPSEDQSSKKYSLFQSNFNGDTEWDQPESLHDEIIRIHNQLPKIVFDDVDMEKRMIVASMNGPWAEKDSLVYIKLTVKFPERYPEMEPPVFEVENTSLIARSTHAKLIRDIQHIAESYSANGKGCLETIFRYLIGELDYEASIFLNDIRILDEDYSPIDESSSDDDSNFLAGAFSEMLPVSNNANVPLPRLCGAVFSNNGKLVIFVPCKKDKFKSLLAPLVTSNNICPKDMPHFERFGQFQSNPLSFGQKFRSLNTGLEGQSDSESSDESDASNSHDFSDQYDRPLFLRYLGDYTSHSFKQNPATSNSHLSSGARTGTGTGTGMESWVAKPKSLLALYSMEDMLPSKIELAREYIVFGNISMVCEYNANVCEKHGFRELGDIWKYIAIILCDDGVLKNLRMMFQECRLKSTGNLVKQSQHSDDMAFSTWSSSFLGRLMWGTHPLAVQLIRDLFTFFEQRVDVQMLAMLSCIVGEPMTKNSVEIEYLITHLQSSLAIKAPTGMNSSALCVVKSTFDKSLIESPGNCGSSESVTSPWKIVPIPIFHSFNDNTQLPPGFAGPEPRNRKSQSLSTSPERFGRTFHRANSVGLASTFAASLYRLASSSMSPPKSSLSRKKISPVEQILSSLTPGGITWGNTTILKSLKEHERSNHETSNHHAKTNLSSQCYGIKVIPQNEHLFEDNFLHHIPLIDPNSADLYTHYRKTYAGLLYSWDLPISQLEILKYNALLTSSSLEQRNTSATSIQPDSEPANYHRSYEQSDSKKNNKKNKKIKHKSFFNSDRECNHRNDDVIIDNRNNKNKKNAIIVGKEKYQFLGNPEALDITGFCIKHESRLEPADKNIQSIGGADGRCKRCKTNQRQLRCTICLEPVSAIFCPCLSCGCVSHLDCLAVYHAQGHTQCPGACDCDCTIKAGLGIVESWEVMMGSLLDQVKKSDDENKIKEQENLNQERENNLRT